jgi:hypothetical protein
MKRLLVLTAMIFVCIECNSQDTLTDIKKAWDQLTSAMQRRNDVAVVLFDQLKQSGIADSALLKDFGLAHKNLHDYLENSKPDSLVIIELQKRNRQFINFLSRALMIMESYPAVKQKETVQQLVTQLESAENRLLTRKKRYNELVREIKRPDLVYN